MNVVNLQKLILAVERRKPVTKVSCDVTDKRRDVPPVNASRRSISLGRKYRQQEDVSLFRRDVVPR